MIDLKNYIIKVMFAIIKTGGKQYKISAGQNLKIEKIDTPEGEKVVFDNILLLDDGELKIGQPVIQGAKVEAEVLKQAKAKKVIVAKYKPKKRQKVKKGHRQPYSEIKILNIVK